MATSAANIQNLTARRLTGDRMELDFVFKQDGNPWDVSALPIKIDVRRSNQAEVIKTWTSIDFDRPATNVIRIDRTSPALAGLPDNIQYKGRVYLDYPATGKETILTFDLWIDAATATSPKDYETGTIKPEAMVLNVVSTIPGVSVDVAGGFEVRLTEIEGRIDNLESLIVTPVRSSIEDIEAEATGDHPKQWALLQDGKVQLVYYVDGADDLVSPVLTSVGGGAVNPGELTHSARIAALEETRLTALPVATYQALLELDDPDKDTLYLVDSDSQNNNDPGLYLRRPNGDRIRFAAVKEN